jgi:predicted acyltransferase
MRLRSLDIFRGLTIASMIVVNSAPGAREEAYSFMRHAPWNGWTFADTIFPAFLWIVGVALTLSTASRLERGASRSSLLLHAATRTALLIGMGLCMNLFYFPERHFPFVGFMDHLQVTGVLQKIAVCYFLAFLIVLWSGWRGALVGIVVLNLTFLALLFFYPVPGCGPGGLSAECNFAGRLDQSVFGSNRWIDGNPHGQDPDGLGSILPATSTVLFGVLIGALLRAKRDPAETSRSILGFGVLLIVCGAALSEWVIPINKPLWTPSYAFLMAGLSSVVFALCYWAADIRRLSFRAFEPFEIYGRNAIAAYAISTEAENIPKLHVHGTSLYEVCLSTVDVPHAALLYALLYTAAVFVPIWWMHRGRWYLKF